MKKKKFRKLDGMETFMFILIGVYVLSMVGVLMFGVINSLKDWLDFEMGNVLGFPSAEYGGWQWKNYLEIWNKFRVQIKPVGQGTRYVYIEEMFLNSMLYSLSMSFFMMLTQVMIAYATAKYDFKFRNLLYNTAVIVMLIPIVGSLPSELSIANALGLKNSILGVSFMRCKYPGIYFLVFYAMFKSIPWSYAEAAQIDGAGHLKIFLKVMLPMVSKTLLSVFILQFIANWNEYFTPMIFIPDKTTIAYGLFMFQSSVEPGIHTTHKLVGCMITSIPIIVLFLVFRNKITGNVTAGGIKG